VENEKQKQNLNVGDIIPIQQVIGFQVVKRIENDEPVVIEVQTQFEAEMLSAAFKN